MGIRCHCPNGHRLNIKTFLAGKRGICPHCGVRFTIPLESDPRLKKGSASGSDSKSHEASDSKSHEAADDVPHQLHDPAPSPSVASASQIADSETVGQFVGPTDDELRFVEALPIAEAVNAHAAKTESSVPAASVQSAIEKVADHDQANSCLLYTSPSPRDATLSRMPSSA